MSIRVHQGFCPIAKKNVCALYDDEVPIVPAIIYLRYLTEEAGLDLNTVRAYAYALTSFFTLLKEANLSFWDITIATIKQFKRYHLSRLDEKGHPLIRRTTVQQYLSALKGLVQFWRSAQDDDPLFFDPASQYDGARRKMRRWGMLLHASWYSRIPNKTWCVKIPREEEHQLKRYKGLSREASKAVMTVLNRANYHTDLGAMLYYRDRAIWTFMLMGGQRIGELVRTRLEDVNPRTGLITLKDRPEDAWLGELKTGSGEIFVTTTNPYWRYLDSWLLEGRWIAEEILKAEGKEDHGMLFCNRDGGPLTQAAVDHLFLRLKRICKFDDSIFFSPHITRHTIANLMRDNGVELSEVQDFMRHRSIQSTEIYAKVSDRKLRQALEAFWRKVEIFS